MNYRQLVSGSDSRHDILAVAKTSEDDSANARILFAKDLVPDEFKRIQEEAFRFLPPSARAAIPPPPMEPAPMPSSPLMPPEWRAVDAFDISELEMRVLREQARLAMPRAIMSGGGGGGGTSGFRYIDPSSWSPRSR